MSGWQGERGSRDERGYGWEWDKLRVRILRRDNYLCVPCSQTGRATPATEVDHVTPKSEDGSDDPENLQSICRGCHQVKTQGEARRASGGRVRLQYDALGFPLWDY